MVTGSAKLSKFVATARRVHSAGVLLALASGVITSVVSFVVKLIPEINPIEIVVTRGLIQTVILLPIIWYHKKNPFGEKGDRLLLLTRGLCGSLYVVAQYAAIHLISYADAMTIIHSSPAFVYIFSFLILKEACGVFHVVIVTVSIAGVLLVSKPTFVFGGKDETSDPHMRITGLLLAFAACLLNSMCYVITGKLKKTSSIVILGNYSYSILIMGALTLSVVSLFFSDSRDLSEGIRIPAGNEICWILVNGIGGTLSQFLLIVAFKIEEAGLVSLARSIDIVMAFALQAIWLSNDAVSWTSIAGAGLVCASISVSSVRRWLSSFPEKWDTVWCLINCGFPKERKCEGDEQVVITVPVRKTADSTK